MRTLNVLGELYTSFRFETQTLKLPPTCYFWIKNDHIAPISILFCSKAIDSNVLLWQTR